MVFIHPEKMCSAVNKSQTEINKDDLIQWQNIAKAMKRYIGIQ